MRGARRCRLPAVTVALATLLAACGGGGEAPLQIGIERSTLDLVFKEDETETAERTGVPDQALDAQPAPSHATFVTSVDEDLSAAPSPALDLCPEAPPGTPPPEPAPVAISRPPAEGVYGYHNDGTFEIDAIVPFSGTYPPVTRRTIRVLDPVGEDERFRTEVEQRLGDNVTTTTYAVTEDALQLAHLYVKAGESEVTFEPTPPVTMMVLGAGEGETWTSGGVDVETGTSMVVEGSITKREAVDVCGEVHDTYRVVSDETIVNVFTGFRHETNEPTVYNVATQHGGLFLREDVDTTTTIPTEQGLVVVHLDYVSVANSVDPEPL